MQSKDNEYTPLALSPKTDGLFSENKQIQPHITSSIKKTLLSLYMTPKNQIISL